MPLLTGRCVHFLVALNGFSFTWHAQLCLPPLFLVRANCRTGFSNYHQRAGTIISGAPTLLQVRPTLTIRSLIQRASPARLSHDVYITATGEGSPIIHVRVPAVIQISGHI